MAESNASSGAAAQATGWDFVISREFDGPREFVINSLVPAARAARVDVMEALRSE